MTAGLHLIGDLVAITAAFLASWVLRFEVQVLPVTKSVPDFSRYLLLLPVVLLLWPTVFYFHECLYEQRRGRSRVDEALRILSPPSSATLLLSGGLSWYRPPAAPGSAEYFTYSRPFLALFAGLGLFFTVAGRMGLRALLRLIRLSGQNIQRILVVGAGALGKEIAEKLRLHGELGLEVVGFSTTTPARPVR